MASSKPKHVAMLSYNKVALDQNYTFISRS